MKLSVNTIPTTALLLLAFVCADQASAVAYSQTVSGGTQTPIANGAAVSLSAGSTILFNDQTPWSFGSLAGAGTVFVINSDPLATSSQYPVTLSIGSDNTSTLFSGSLGDVGGMSTVIKTGTGVLSLSGQNTFLTNLQINQGTLQFNKAQSFWPVRTGFPAINVSVASGATLALNVGGTGEFTSASVDALVNKTGIFGNTAFASGSALGLDTTNAAGSQFTYSGSIGANISGISKLGAGTLKLSGTSTYTGATTISAGILQASSTSALGSNSAVSVASGATLDASSVAGLNTGALTLVSGSILKLNGTTRINASGNVTVASGVKLQAAATGFVLGQQVAILTTTGTVSALAQNTFDTSLSEASLTGYRWASTSDATHLYLGLQLASITATPSVTAGFSQQQLAVAKALDSATSAVSTNADIQAVYAAIHQNGANIASIINHLSGSSLSAIGSSSYSVARNNIASNHSSAGAPFGLSTFASFASIDNPQDASRATSLKELATQKNEKDWHVFAYYSHISGTKAAGDNGFADSEFSSNGATVGINNLVAEDWNVGATLVYDNGETDSGESVANIKTQSYGANLYAGHTLDADKVWLLSGSLGYAYAVYHSARYGVGANNGIATANLHGDTFSGALQLSYKTKPWQSVDLTPFVGTSYVSSNIKGGQESLPGAQGLALAFENSKVDAFETQLGAEIAQNFSGQAGIKFIRSARIAWHHLLNAQDDRSTATHFVGDPSNSFNTYLQSVSQDALSFELGLKAQFNNQWSAFANVRDYEDLGGAHAHQLGFGVGMQYSW